jgi:hypothetical protein
MLRNLSLEQEKTSRLNSLTTNKTKKEMESMRKQLSHERSLKLDAFNRVDELQTQVCTLSFHTQFSVNVFLPTP